MPNPEERKSLEETMDQMVQIILGKGWLSREHLTFTISPEGCSISKDGKIIYDNTKDDPWVV